MFSRLHQTRAAQTFDLLPIHLPGFGAPPSTAQTSLESLATFVADRARAENAQVVLGHSLASVIASLAARRADSPIRQVLSLEGNLTADDAYFSGTAANYDSPESFRSAFLEALAERSRTEPVVARYRDAVAKADPRALWQLGTDARRFSDEQVPGEVLAGSARPTYIYNPSNCHDATLVWLQESGMERIVLEGASHWASVDQPESVSEAMIQALE